MSPSPNKEKRRRMLSPAILPLPKLQLQALGYDSDNNEGDGEEDNDPFIDDSPMKPATNGKAFTALFEETIKPISTSELFGNSALAIKARTDVKPPKTKLPDMDLDIFNDDSRSIKKPSFKTGPSVKSHMSALTKSRSKLIQSTLPFIDNTLNGTRKRSPSQTRASDVSVLSIIEHANGMVADDTKELPPFANPLISAPRLLPPSPNPNASHLSGKSKSNSAQSSQSSNSVNHKKPRLQSYDTMEDTESDDGLNMRHTVKIIHHSRGIRAVLGTEESNPEIKDPILSCVQPRSQGSASFVKQGDNDDTEATVDKDEDRDADVNADDEELVLPSRLRRNLVLESWKSKRTEYEEERIVKGLLSGRRVFHYDPKKGGEIWGVGEDERDELPGDEGVVDEVSDEWEGDPVPWQVGELSESHYHLEEL